MVPNPSQILEGALKFRGDNQLGIGGLGGLSVPWTEFLPEGARYSSADIQMGPEGVTATMMILIHWKDLSQAVQDILGYSYRFGGTVPNVPAVLKRMLPMRNPNYSQLWARSISSCRGIQLAGINMASIVQVGGGGAVLVAGGNPGGGGPPDDNPPLSATNYNYAVLTVHFWRPPYAVRTDASITNGDGVQQEWLRYVDKHWTLETQMFSGSGGSFTWVGNGTGKPATGAGVPGSVGVPLPKMTVKRRWYQIPEEAIFLPAFDSSSNGLPNNLLYARTTTSNPITGYVRAGATSNFNGFYNGIAAGQTILGTVNSPIGGAAIDTDPTKRFFGCYAGTLLYLGVEFIPQPLQIPASLMRVTSFIGGEPLNQVQYDIVFHFSLFDPPLCSGESNKGHNTMPWSGNGQFAAVQSQIGMDGSQPPGVNQAATIFHYADFTDLFTII